MAGRKNHKSKYSFLSPNVNSFEHLEELEESEPYKEQENPWNQIKNCINLQLN